MRTFLANARRFGRDESGIAVTEYGLLIATALARTLVKNGWERVVSYPPAS